MAEPAVRIEKLTHRYGTHTALRDVTLTIEPGTLFGLVGPNGSGKTTLFRILSTLMPPSAGQMRIFGDDPVTNPSAVRQQLGFVFQEPALDDNLTVRENLRAQGALYGLRGSALHARIDELLADLDVADRADDRVHTLSGGLQRRVDLVRGLLHRPNLLLLDEPTTGLDPAARRTFWQSIDRLRRSAGTTLLVATHLMEEAERCDAVAILDRGRVVADGTPSALKADLGEETLWLESPDPQRLRDHIQAQFGIDARVIDSTVQLAPPDAPQLLTSIYSAFEDQIESATVRAPTLEDVFMVRTGHRPEKEKVSG